MNERSDCTSPVTRLMIEPEALASKKRKSSRCSLSNTSERRRGTMSSCSRRPTAME